MAQHSKPRILFVSESVTLAHFARPFELSNRLDKNNYDIHFACATLYQKFLAASTHTIHTIQSIPAEQFKQALAQGNPLYDFATLKSYAEEDLALIAKVKPDLIVGDFRISLAVSARLAKVPYATISNAYWSPYAPAQYPLPCLPLAKYLGVTAGSAIFKLVAPLAFKAHALAMRRLRNHFGLPKVALDLRQVYTDADFTLYADLPSLFPLHNPPENHFFIGPVLWSPPIQEPTWWHQLPTDRKVVYVSMGSSGSPKVLETVLKALSNEATLIASTAGANVDFTGVSGIFTADYIDGNAAAERANLVICNGGSLTCQQAFAHGKPVIGIADNMDQFLNMQGVKQVNAGLMLRADNLTKSEILESYCFILQNINIFHDTTILREESFNLQKQNIFIKFISSLL